MSVAPGAPPEERTLVELQHSFTVPAGVEAAWATLLDVEGIAPCFPGATLTGSDGDEFAGLVKVKLGPVSLQYAGKGRFVERDDVAHRAVIEAHGSDKRGNGTAGATVIAHLEAETEDTTRVVVSTELKVTGRPAQFGRGVMQDVGGRIVDQFAANLARHIAGEDTAAAEPAPVAAAPVAAASASPVAAASAPSVPAPAELPPSLANATAPTAPARPAAPRPPSLPRSTPAPELDLNSVVLPVLARQYGPTVVAVLVTAIVTWFIARRRR
jgi:carbon monoxide dehydrogenase subunit G